MHSIVQYNIKNVTVFYEYDCVSIYNDNLFETRVVNSGNNNSHMLGPIWKFLFSENPLYSIYSRKKTNSKKLERSLKNESERIFIATKIARQKDSNRICSQLNRLKMQCFNKYLCQTSRFDWFSWASRRPGTNPATSYSSSYTTKERKGVSHRTIVYSYRASVLQNSGWFENIAVQHSHKSYESTKIYSQQTQQHQLWTFTSLFPSPSLLLQCLALYHPCLEHKHK